MRLEKILFLAGALALLSPQYGDARVTQVNKMRDNKNVVAIYDDLVEGGTYLSPVNYCDNCKIFHEDKKRMNPEGTFMSTRGNVFFYPPNSVKGYQENFVTPLPQGKRLDNQQKFGYGEGVVYDIVNNEMRVLKINTQNGPIFPVMKNEDDGKYYQDNARKRPYGTFRNARGEIVIKDEPIEDIKRRSQIINEMLIRPNNNITIPQAPPAPMAN